MIPFSFILIAEIISMKFSFHPTTLFINGFYLYEIVRFVWIMVDACNLVFVILVLETQGNLGKILVQHKDASFEALDEVLGEHATCRGEYVELGTYNMLQAKTFQSKNKIADEQPKGVYDSFYSDRLSEKSSCDIEQDLFLGG